MAVQGVQPQAQGWMDMLWGGFVARPAARQAGAVVEANQGPIVQRIRDVVTDALVGPQTAPFEETRIAIEQFLAAPNRERAARLQELLTQICPKVERLRHIGIEIPPKQYEAIYQLAEIGPEKQAQIEILLEWLHANVIPEEANWQPDNELRADLEQVAATMQDVIDNSRGALARATEYLERRVGDMVQDNRVIFIRTIQEMSNLALFGLPPATQNALDTLLANIEQPLRHELTGERKQVLHELLTQLSPDEHPLLYQQLAIPEDKQEQIRRLLRPVDQWGGDEQIRAELGELEVILKDIHESSLGLFARAGGDLNDRLIRVFDPVARRIEQIPANIINDEELLESVLQRSRVILGHITEAAGEIFAMEAAKSLAKMFIFICNRFIKYLQKDFDNLPARERQARQPVINTINQLKEKLQREARNGSWEDLIEVLEECHTELQKHDIYIQNFRLPLAKVEADPNPIPLYLRHLEQHAAVLGNQRAALATIPVTQVMIEEEALKLKTKAAAYGPILFISRSILGLEESEATYAALINIPSGTASNEWNNLFKTRFHTLIDDSDRFFVKKWVAKACYFFLRPLSSFYSDALISNGISAFESWKNAPEDPTNPKEVQLIGQARKWLAKLSASYKEAADTPVGEVTDLKEMLEKAVQSPQRNKGLTSSELYHAVSVTALDAFGPRFEWRQGLCQYYKLQIPSSSMFQFLNPVLSGINLVLSWTTHALLFIPEWIANQVLRLGTRLALKTQPFLENNLKRTLSSFRSNTQTAHAMNEVIYKQLEKISEHLTNHLAAEDAGEALPPSNSMTRQVELTPLVENLLEVLNYSRYGTQHRLKNYIDGRMSLRDRAEKELDDLFLPEALEQAVGTISIVLDSVLKKESLNELLFNCLTVANSSMDAAAPVSPEEFAGREQSILNLSDQILERSVSHAIRKKLDFTGEAQKRGVRQFTDTLKEQSRQIVTSIQEQIAQVNPNALTHDGKGRLSAAVEASQTFMEGRVTAVQNAQGNPHFHAEPERKLEELDTQLGNAYDPIATHLEEALQNHKEWNNFKTVEGSFLGMQRCVAQIHALDRGAQVQQLVPAQVPALNLTNLITQIAPLSHLIPRYQQIKDNSNQLRQAMTRAETERRKLDNLHPNTDPRIIREIHASMNRFYAARDEAAALTQTLQADINAQIQQATDQLEHNRAALQGHFEQLRLGLNAFQAFADADHEIHIWNLSVIDMQWVTEMTRGIACEVARGKVKKVRKALYESHNLIGLVNQGSQFFLEQFGRV